MRKKKERILIAKIVRKNFKDAGHDISFPHSHKIARMLYRGEELEAGHFARMKGYPVETLYIFNCKKGVNEWWHTIGGVTVF